MLDDAVAYGYAHLWRAPQNRDLRPSGRQLVIEGSLSSRDLDIASRRGELSAVGVHSHVVVLAGDEQVRRVRLKALCHFLLQCDTGSLPKVEVQQS